MMAQSGSLAGRTALVTGGSRGIGRAIALQLGGEGAAVCVNYRSDKSAADEVVKAIVDKGGTAYAIQADVSDRSDVERLVATAKDRLGSIDILVNNAGIGEMGSVGDTDDALFDAMMDVNAKGPFLVTRAVLPQMNDGGRIVNISSMVSRTAYGSCIAYAMSKAAVNHFTVSLAQELGARGITVNAVCPGATRTDFNPVLFEDETIVAQLAQAAALGRIGEPEDIARVVGFLAGPASGWVTGQIIEASGGMHL